MKTSDRTGTYLFLKLLTFEKETLKRNQNFPVPCIFTAFKFLFSTTARLETNGDAGFTTLKSAVEFNSSAKKADSQTICIQLPAFAYTNLVIRIDIHIIALGCIFLNERDFAGCYPEKLHFYLSRSPVGGLVLSQIYLLVSNCVEQLKPKTFW